jgi:uncharacterized protein
MPAREDVTFDSRGSRCAAWLYRPEGADGPGPCVVMAHGFSGTRHERIPAFAERFVAEGFAALCFDYRHFGDSEGEPRQLLDIGRQHDDWRAAVAYTRTLPGVDPERIVLWGSSFSGGHVIHVAAEDPRIAAVISQVPFTDGIATVRGLGAGPVLRATPHALLDAARGLAGRSPHLIPAVAAPGKVGVMTTPSSEPGFRALVPPESTWRNEVAARVFLWVPLYRPGKRAARLRMPLFVGIATGDGLTPPAAAERWATAAPDHRIERYPVDHFDPYLGEPFEALVGDEVDFLRTRVLGAPS